MTYPLLVMVFSGKRKSGKDYVTDLLFQRIGKEHCSLLRLSEPLKSQYAKEHNLDLDKLLDSSQYKEQYRAAMIRWGEERRKQQPDYFCKLTTQGEGCHKPVWIITDARRKTDVEYFQKVYPKSLVTLRVDADISVREQRGFLFTKGIDDAESECGLDVGVGWDVIILNNGDNLALDSTLDDITHMVHQRLQEANFQIS
ncbi:phosphomevalonate kinase-like [Saccoglossus kowalevskii]|uniref:Phosphomevalonate kinase n=1 Tax=Saccoglossus kowalevskii TaxID=10224 RepID=A0ABM0GK90_SACKO|nr:PREDICTED: phosphomevalonate kinase-like [Saccoglossus kowalevskii]